MAKVARLRYQRRFLRHGVYTPESSVAAESVSALRARLERGETVYLAGLGVAGHNSGASLLEVSAARGISLISNDEEERFTAVKHFDGYPEQALQSLQLRLADRGLTPRDLHAIVLSWDYVALVTLAWREAFSHFPWSLNLRREGATNEWDFSRYNAMVCDTPRRLAAQWGLDQNPPLICMPHHENHASFSYLFSPFNRDDKPVMIAVCDGFGDRGAISLFVTENGQLRNLRQNESLFDSLGMFYSILSSTQGGWTPLSSEGRYMGAAAWGDGNRLTNPYYRRLRQIFHFAEEGKLFINREMVNWHVAGELTPYAEPLRQLIGDPIPHDRMWNPDAVLCVNKLQHADATHDRVDLAAATQLVFEDALFHIVEHLIRTTRSDRLILTGGTALNCLANMELLERFDEGWYQRNLGMRTRLHLWVPPTPGDAGVTMGAACSLALRAGARGGAPMQHAFYCGIAPTSDEVRDALQSATKVEYCELGNINEPQQLEEIADVAADIVARDGVLGIYQGAAETGPRALGHRSIVANPCNPRTLETINLRVKFREPIRPLAPMATLSAAHRFWELSPGAATDNYSAYNYMVLTVRARPEAYEKIPAVIHKDGTSRVQIVRQEQDPFTFAYLRALGRINGAEVSVNTSLNVGSPIAQTPGQALAVMLRAKDKSGMVLIASDGTTYLSWPSGAPDPRDVEAAVGRKG